MRFPKLDLLSVYFLAASANAVVVRAPEAGGELIARGPNSRWSYQDVQGQIGSCGSTQQNSQFIVAMNSQQMTSSLCFTKIRMTYGGKTTTATITDTCFTCPNNGLDLSPALFTFFAGSLTEGTITGDWETI